MKLFNHESYKDTLIGSVQNTIFDIFKKNLSDNSVLVNTTHLGHSKEKLEHFVEINSNKKILLFSGMDWESTNCRKEIHNWLNKYDVEHIGNTNNEYYFSFWIEFAKVYMSNISVDYTKSITKPFMCLNRKPHQHRLELVNILTDKNLCKFGFVSMGNYNTLKAITLDNDIVNTLGDLSTFGDNLHITNDITSLGNMNYWHDHFLNVVTETTIHTDVFISEKTLKPILGYKPFVILGDRNLYNKLHQLGIDTFDDIFGTGYSNKWHDDRIKWIVDVIERVSKEKNLDLLYRSLLPRLIKNKEILKKQMRINFRKIQKVSKRF